MIYRSHCQCICSAPEPSTAQPLYGRDGRELHGAAFWSAYLRKLRVFWVNWLEEVDRHNWSHRPTSEALDLPVMVAPESHSCRIYRHEPIGLYMCEGCGKTDCMPW